MEVLFRNIKGLYGIREAGIEKVSGKEMADFPGIENAWLLARDGRIADFGPTNSCPESNGKTIDLQGRFLLPTFIDSHTHIIYAGTREGEFRDRIKGLSYEEIATRGGGILNSARKLRESNEAQLLETALQRINEVMLLGTGALEIKSGYGLNVESELKMLHIARQIGELLPIPVKSTFLGAHAVPQEFHNNRKGYLKLVIGEILPRVAEENLADFVDIFCEKNYFTPDESRQLFEAARKYGLRPKVHVNQFNSIGGLQAALEFNALSVDHLEVLTNEDLVSLGEHPDTMPVALPGCSFFLGIPYTNARRIIDAGGALAIASDYNPGSAPSGNISFLLSLACIRMKLLPEEALNAVTLNAAYALELQDELGSITRGKRASLIITKEIPSLSYIPYHFSHNMIENVFIKDSFLL